MSNWNHAEQVARVAADPDAAAREILRLLNRNVELDRRLVAERERCKGIAEGWLQFWSWNPDTKKHDCSKDGDALTYGRRQAAEVIARDIEQGADSAQITK